MSTPSMTMVILRDDTTFPTLRFAFTDTGLYHVMVSGARARCGRFLPRTVTDTTRRLPRHDIDGMRVVCADCIRDGLAFGTIRVQG